MYLSGICKRWLVVKKKDNKKTQFTMRLDHMHLNMDTTLGPTMNAIGRTHNSFKKKESTRFVM